MFQHQFHSQLPTLQEVPSPVQPPPMSTSTHLGGSKLSHFNFNSQIWGSLLGTIGEDCSGAASPPLSDGEHSSSSGVSSSSRHGSVSSAECESATGAITTTPGSLCSQVSHRSSSSGGAEQEEEQDYEIQCEALLRERHSSGSIFPRRRNFASFNVLPKTKINSYHIKTEEDGSHGNDETRCFILSTLSSHHLDKVRCCLCKNWMQIYDRYPLCDGTFFLSPRAHTSTAPAIPTSASSSRATNSPAVSAALSQYMVSAQRAGGDSKKPLNFYLNAVCMPCLEGWNFIVRCKSCRRRWDGSHLILGTLYTFDIFAAIPCCTDRLRCGTCDNVLPMRGPAVNQSANGGPGSSFSGGMTFSAFSHPVACSRCGIVENHFVKALHAIYEPVVVNPNYTLCM